jgi:solute carrier family 25 protein 42
MSEKNHHLDSLLKFFSGGLAGIIAKTAIAPVDRVKFLFMASVREFSVNSMLNEIRRIRVEEGFRSLWKGNLAQLLRVFPYSGVVRSIQQFSVYGRMEKVFSKRFGDDQYSRAFSKFLAGSLAGSAAMVISYPFDTMRTRLAYQTTKKLYNGIIHGFFQVVKNEGFFSLFKGISPALIGVTIYGGATFSIFFTLKNNNPEASKTQIFLYGAGSGLVGQILSYPFDVVRKRMLAHGFIEKVSNFTTSTSNIQVNSMSSYFKEIWKNEGFRGLMKGISLNFVKAPIMLGTVHLANHLIHKHFNEDY